MRRIFPPIAQQPLVGQGLLIIEASQSHSGNHIRYDNSSSSGTVIGEKEIFLPDNTKHLQETGIYAPGGIRTRNPSKRTVADPRISPRFHREQLTPVHCT